MPFFYQTATYHTILKNSKDSLQSLLKTITPKSSRTIRKRVLQFISPKASMTVEATVALPLFLFALFFFLFFLEVIRIQTDIGTELHQIGKEIAVYGYLYDRAEGAGMISESMPTAVVTNVFTNLYVEHSLKDSLRIEEIEQPFIDGGISGINFMLSSYMENDVIDIIAMYRIKIPFNYFGLESIPVVQRARIRAWTGYKGEHTGIETERMVYITHSGEVYHEDFNCSYLNPTIQEVRYSQIPTMRNRSGAKFYPCELCQDADIGGSDAVFITDYGNRYHTTRTCSGLKREIKVVPISQVGARRPCSRCGGSHE